MNTSPLMQINGIPIKRNFITDLPYNPALKYRAKALRKAGNFPEVVFWKQVRNKSFWNLDFDRQRIIGNYIVDFYVKSLGLIVEIDSESHNDKDTYDEKREAFLVSLDLRLFRTSSLKILHDTANAMKDLERYIVAEYKIPGEGENIINSTTPSFGHPSMGGE